MKIYDEEYNFEEIIPNNELLMSNLPSNKPTAIHRNENKENTNIMNIQSSNYQSNIELKKEERQSSEEDIIDIFVSGPNQFGELCQIRSNKNK